MSNESEIYNEANNVVELLNDNQDYTVGSTTIKLIREVERYEELYNSTYFKDTVRTKQAWYEISKVIGVSADVCKRKWNCLRDTYRRTKRKLDDLGINALDPGPSTVSWEYYKFMTFLHPYIRKKRETTPDVIEIKTEFDPDLVMTSPFLPAVKTSPISTINRPGNIQESKKRPLINDLSNSSVSENLNDIYKLKYPKLEVSLSPDKFLLSPDNRGQGPSNISQFTNQTFPIHPDSLTARLQEEDFNRMHLMSKSSFYNQPQLTMSSSRIGEPSHLISSNSIQPKQLEDADDLFVRSIAASLSRFPSKLKAMAKVKIQKALWEAEEAFEQVSNGSVSFIDASNL